MLSALQAAQRAIRGGGLCGRLSVLPVTGAAVALLRGPMLTEMVCATDRVAARIDELQFDLGEGPCWQACAAGRPVLVSDLHHGPDPRWPVFAGAARAVPARAMFAFPLRIGTIGFGALDLYRGTPGPLDAAAVHDARVLAATVAAELLRRILAAPPPGDGSRPVAGSPGGPPGRSCRPPAWSWPNLTCRPGPRARGSGRTPSPPTPP